MNDSASPPSAEHPPAEEASRPLHTRLAPWLAFWALVAAGVGAFFLYLAG